MVSIQQFLTEGIRNLGKVSEAFAKDPSKFAGFIAGIRRETNWFDFGFITEYLEIRDRVISHDSVPA